MISLAQKEKLCVQSLVQEIPHNLGMAKAMSQRVSLLFFPCEPGLSEAQLQLRGAPLLAGPRGSCGWQFLLRWWLSELLPGLKEATSKDAATTTDKWNQKALPQPRRFLNTFYQSSSLRSVLLLSGFGQYGGPLCQAALYKYKLIPQC